MITIVTANVYVTATGSALDPEVEAGEGTETIVLTTEKTTEMKAMEEAVMVVLTVARYRYTCTVDNALNLLVSRILPVATVKY